MFVARKPKGIAAFDICRTQKVIAQPLSQNRLLRLIQLIFLLYCTYGFLISRAQTQTFTDALDQPGLVWTIGGNAPWFAQTTNTYDGIDAAQSGTIGNSQYSWIQTTVTGPGTLSFYWKVSSEANYDFLEFYIDGVRKGYISGALNWGFSSGVSLTNGTHTLAWQYKKDSAISSGQDRGWLDNVLWVPADGPPLISRQPEDKTFWSGTTATLSAIVGGAPPLGYQWMREGTNLVNATNTTLSINNVGLAYQGNYQLAITNALGAVTSVVAQLSVLEGAPQILSIQPSNQVVFPGSPATFTAQVAGSQPTYYQWRLYGTNIPKATNASLVLNRVSVDQEGPYSVLISNSFGTTLSSNVVLTVQPICAWGDNSYGQTNVPASLSNMVAIAAGYSHSLALKGDGKVIVWGDNTYGQRSVPVGLSNVVAIAGGARHSMALKVDGVVVAWGNNSSGQTNVPLGLSDVVAIASGGSHNLALRTDGTVVAWGDNAYGQSTVPAGLSNVVAIAGGGSHSIALKTDGSIIAWGNNSYGQTSIPSGLSNVVGIACGSSHSLALRADGRVTGWGYNFYEQTSVPYDLSNVVAIACGSLHSLAVRADGRVSGWGQVTAPTTLTNIASVAGGSIHDVALTAKGFPAVTLPAVQSSVAAGGKVFFAASALGAPPLAYQWQCNGTNVLGATNRVLTLTNLQLDQAGSYNVKVSNSYGETVSASTILEVAPIGFATQPQNQMPLLGRTATLSVMVNGVQPLYYQWLFNGTDIPGANQSALVIESAGWNHEGYYSLVASNGYGYITSAPASLWVSQIAAGGTNDYGQTNVPVGLGKVTGIGGGEDHGMAIKADGTVTAWGRNNDGQTNVPAGLTNVVAITGGSWHSLALQADGSVVAWGGGSDGQTNVPVGLTNVVAVAARGSHNLALKSDGTVAAWGWNYYGQTNAPSGLTNVVAVSAGGAHSLAIKADGTVIAWGCNDSGQTNVPSGLSNVVAVSAGGSHNLVLKADGTVTAWGYNYYNSYGQTNVPSGLSNVVAIAAGNMHSVALKADGTIVSWGDNRARQCSSLTNLTNACAITAPGDYTLALLGDGPPRITSRMVDRSVVRDGPAFFFASAIGLQPLNYQWQFNGVDLLGATNAMLSLTNVQPEQTGFYSVRVSNTLGETTSPPAHLGLVPLQLAAPLRDQTVLLGSPVNWHVEAIGTGPFGYQWLFNGTNLSDANQDMLFLPATGWNDQGWYAVIVTNSYGSVTSAPAFLWNLQVLAWGSDNLFGQTNLPTGLTSIVATATGDYHNLALRTDGTVIAWGKNLSGQTNVPAGLSNVVAVSGGVGYSLALKSDGTVAAWGAGTNFENFAKTLSNVVSIAAGGSHGLALKDKRTVVAWGSNNGGQTNVPAGLTNVVAIDGGYQHSLALQADGKVVAWGTNNYGQANVPAGLNRVVAIAAGKYHNLALRADGTVVAWGRNSDGQTNVPPTLTNVVAIAAGGYHCMALRTDGTVVHWGYGSSGQTNPPVFLTNVNAIVAGEFHSLVSVGDGPPRITAPLFQRSFTKNGSAFFSISASGTRPMSFQWQCNGTNVVDATNAWIFMTNMQPEQAGLYSVVLSNSLASVTSAPALLSADSIWISRPPSDQTNLFGSTTTFEVGVEGSPPINYQWLFNDASIPSATAATFTIPSISWSNQGNYKVVVSNSYGAATSSIARLMLGQLATWKLTTNFQVSLSNLVAVSAGGYHNLGLRRDGTVVAWGTNSSYDYGQARVPLGLSNVAAVAAGSEHSLALRSDGKVTAWGHGYGGQTNVPGDLSNVVSIAAGDLFSMALKSDGTVATWGYSTFQQSNVPKGLTNVVAIAAGDSHMLALRANGTVVGWGLGNFNSYSNEFQLWGFSNVIAIAGGTAHSAFLKTDGQVVVLGDGSMAQKKVPTNLTGVASIAAAGNFTLALKENGTLDAWGECWDSTGGPPLRTPVQVPVTLSNIAAISQGWHAVYGSRSVDEYPSLALAGDGGPHITSPLVNRFGIQDQAVYFTVSAIGQRPLFYQWQCNGTNVPGGTNTVLALTNVQPGRIGLYSVRVTNALGEATSGQAQLDVVPIWLSSQPQDQTAFLGRSASFNITAEGTGPLSYQWWLNGAPVTGATQSLLFIAAASSSHHGLYTMVVSNVNGSVTSAPALLSVVPIYAWGANGSGQCDLSPQLTNVSLIAAGVAHSLALRTDGTVVGWGDNASGQAGIPIGLGNAVGVAAGNKHSLALKTDGTVVAWGNTNYGQADVPIGLTNLIAVAAGAYHSLALKADGTVYAWGTNNYGQTTVPTGLTNVVAIAAGAYHNLALMAEGTVVAWGWNAYGQTTVPARLDNVVAIAAGNTYSLALKTDGSVVSWGESYSPPPSFSNAVAITAGGSHSLAIRADGSAVGWGNNNYGQANPPVWLSNAVSIAAGGSHSVVLVGDLNLGPQPVIMNPSYSLGGSGYPFYYRIFTRNTATGYAAIGLPPGLSLDASSGTITGIPGKSGIFDVTLYATNTTGVGQKNLKLRINGPPGIESQLTNQVAAIGSNVTFTVDAGGAPPIRYQWRKNGENIPGATNASLTITNVQLADGGAYSVVVANPYGSVVSNPALLLVTVNSAVQTADNFADRQPLIGLSGYADGTNTLATREQGEPNHAGKTGSNSFWYTWLAPADGIATFKTVGNTFDTLLSVYQGSVLTNLIPVTADDDRGGYFASQVRFNVQLGESYQIAVDGFAGATGKFVLEWSLEQTSETIPMITSAPVGVTVMVGDTATFQVGAQGTGLQYQWFYNNFALWGDTNTILTVNNVQRSDAGWFSVSVTNSTGRGVVTVPVALEIGSIAVQSVDKFQDMFSTSSSLPASAPLPNKSGTGPANGPVFGGGGGILGTISVASGTIIQQIFSTVNSTTEAQEPPPCRSIGGASRWYTVVAQADGHLVLDTTGSDFDTVMMVFTASFPSLPIACDDNSAADGIHSRILLSVTNGMTVYVSVDGRNGAKGVAQLSCGLGIYPWISTTVQNLSALEGSRLPLQVNLGGTPPPMVQWLRDGVPLPGATNPVMLLPKVQLSDMGEYSVLVSNFVGVSLAKVAQLGTEGSTLPVVGSAFATSEEGWALTTPEASLAYTNQSGGQSGSLLVQKSVNNYIVIPWKLRAPVAFYGDRTLAYGGLLQFDLKQSEDLMGGYGLEVELEGQGRCLTRKVSWQKESNWARYKLPLHENAQWRNKARNRSASHTDMLQVLGSLTNLTISGFFPFQTNRVELSNVAIWAAQRRQMAELAMDNAMTVSKQHLQLQWSDVPSGFVLEGNDSLTNQNGWLAVPVVYDTNTGINSVIIMMTNQNKYLRLKKP